LGQRIALTLGQAEKHYQGSRLKEAELAYREVLLLDPANAAAQKGLDRLQAETYAADAQRAYDQLTASLYADGMRLYRQKEWDRAAVKLQEAAKLNPDQPQVKKFLGASLSEAARQRDLDRARSLVVQAQSAEAAQDWLRAFAAWQEAARMQPPAPGAAEGVRRTGREVESLVAALLAQARKNLDAENYAAAREGYEKVLALFPENADAWNGAKKTRAALNLKKTSRGNQAEAQKLYNRGVEAYRRGDLSQTISAWESAHAADPQDAGIREALARAQKEQGEAREKNRRLAQARYEDGLAAYQRGELDEALAAWKETLELDPEHAKARANLKRVEQEMK
jgi:tetratricopeptide (TPR) repeat protein